MRDIHTCRDFLVCALADGGDCFKVTFFAAAFAKKRKEYARVAFAPWYFIVNFSKTKNACAGEPAQCFHSVGSSSSVTYVDVN